MPRSLQRNDPPDCLEPGKEFAGRLGILVSHPIQYYAPWFRLLARHLEVEVLYAHRQDARGQADAGFQHGFEWDTDLLGGYSSRWLNNVARRPRVGGFFGCDTPELYQLAQKSRWRCALVFGWNYKSAWQMFNACRQNRIPVLMRGDSQLPGRRSPVKRIAKYLPYRTLLPRLDGHLYVGRRNREYLEYYGVPEKRLFFVPHCVDNDWFAARAEEAAAQKLHLHIRQSLGIPEGAFVLLFVGKLIAKKRPLEILRSLLLPPLKESQVHLIVVGTGPLESEMRDLATVKVHFAGFQNQSRLPGYYRAADLLVLPSSVEETWGLVVNEAIACGLPAVVSRDVGCAPDLIEEGQTGISFPDGDTQAMGEAILRMRDLSRSRPREIQDALRRKASDYSLTAATEGLFKALRAVSRPSTP